MTATKIQPGDDTHLTSLMAPHSLNFVTGADRAALLAYGRDVFAAARGSKCLAQIEEPAGAAPAAVAPQGEDWRKPTTYLQRFGDAIALLCHGRRPDDLVLSSWLDGSSFVLQQFAIDNGPAWAQGIGLIDAATIAADQPTEGVAHEMRADQSSAVSVPTEGHKLWAVFRQREDENDGKEFLHYALWHKDTILSAGERYVEGYFVPLTPAAPALEAPAAPAVPAGFALVPIEPTQQMLDAGRWSGAGSVSIHEEWARKEVWSRMLATVTPPPAAYADDLVALVTELVQALRKATPDNDLAGHALDYLKRNGLQESPLRAADTAPQAPAAPVHSKTYSDGTVATGSGELPAQSPQQQVLCTLLDTVEAMLGGANGPTIQIRAALLAAPAAPVGPSEADIAAAREHIADVHNATQMRSALSQLRHEVVVELVARGLVPSIYAPMAAAPQAPAAPAVDARDTARMDWLEAQVVNVRAPLRYGSRDMFWASPEEVDGGPDGPSDLRARIDAAAAQAKEGGAAA